MIQKAHAFRGEYIDLCAHIERWAVTAICSSQAMQTGNVPAKPPHLLGQKIALITELANDRTDVFAHPKRVRVILEQLAPFLKLRSDLAHAVMTIAITDDGPVFVFEVPKENKVAFVGGRFWITPAEATKVLADLRRVRKLLFDQRLATPKVARALPVPPCPASPPHRASGI